MEISGNIPVNAGLSSSSAIVVAWVRFLVATQGKSGEISDYQIGRWAYEAEVLFFDQPGGLMDQYTIAQKGLFISIQKVGKAHVKCQFGQTVGGRVWSAQKNLGSFEKRSSIRG